MPNSNHRIEGSQYKAKAVRFAPDVKGGDVSKPLELTSFLGTVQEIVDMQIRRERFDEICALLLCTIRPDQVLSFLDVEMPQDRSAISTELGRHYWGKLVYATRNLRYMDIERAKFVAFFLMGHVWATLYCHVFQHLPEYGSSPPDFIDMTQQAIHLGQSVATTLLLFYNDCSLAVFKSLSGALANIFFCAYQLRYMLIARKDYKFELFSPHRYVSRCTQLSALLFRARVHHVRNGHCLTSSHKVRAEFVLFGGIQRLHGQRYFQASAKVLETKAVVTGICYYEAPEQLWYGLRDPLFSARLEALQAKDCEESLNEPEVIWRKRMLKQCP
jgi:hypothetical protein